MSFIKWLALFAFCTITTVYAQEVVENGDIDIYKYAGELMPETLLKKTSVKFEDVPLEFALNSIDQEYALNLSYNKTRMPLDKRVNIVMDDVFVLEALLGILKNTGTTLQFTKGGNIAITPAIGSPGGGNDAKEGKKYSTIKGKVVEKATGSPLPGTNVFLEGTSLGSAADLKGEYSISKVPPGNYTLVFKYIGYKDLKKTVFVEGGKESRQNAKLEWAAVKANQITITAQAEGQLAAINQQLSSNTIRNVVAADRIRELPDADAATALSRLPGVSLRGSQVVIRGITPKMNQMLINGVPIPSANQENRAVNMGLISANMLDGIEVIKAVTPDMDANSVGGTVNLRLREAPEDFYFDVLTEGAYNEMHYKNDNYKLWLSTGRRFFDNRFGINFELNTLNTNLSSDQLSAGFQFRPWVGLDTLGAQINNVNSLTLRDEYGVRDKIGGSVVMDYKMGGGKIAFNTVYSRETTDRIVHNDNIYLSGNVRNIFYEHNKSYTELISNALHGEHTFFSSKVDYSISHSFINRDDDFHYRGRVDFKRYEVFDQELKTSQINALTVQSAFNRVNQPDDPFGQIHSINWTPLSTEEQDLTAQINYEIPVAFSTNINSTVKFGGKYSVKTREADRIWRTASPSGIPYEYDPPELEQEWGISRLQDVFLDRVRNYDYDAGDFAGGDYTFPYALDVDDMDRLVQIYRPAMTTVDPRNGTEDYKGEEQLSAAYAMAEINFGPRLMVLPGIRYESMHTDYDAFFTKYNGGLSVTDYYPTNAERENKHFFPALHVRYKATKWFDVRLAYTETISRPDYRMIAPVEYVNLEGEGRIVVGNPEIKPALSKNIDLFTSFYSNILGLFTIGAFYKQVDDMYYEIRRPNNDVQLYGYPDTYSDVAYIEVNENNPFKGTIKGLEFDWQTQFWYLPSVLSSMVLNINYTKMSSETTFRNFEQKTEIITWFPLFRDTTWTVTHEYTGRLIDQGNDVANIALGFDYKGLSTRLSFVYQGDVLTSLGNRPENNRHTEDLYRWDFTLKQQLPVDGLQLFADILNLTNAPYQAFEPTRHLLSHIRYSGTSYRFGLRYKY